MKTRKPRRAAREKTTRNPELTQQRILEAALNEFARHGFAGARVDVIARSARVNKRMLYHYFGDKEELFRAVLRCKISARKAWMSDAPPNAFDALPRWAELMGSDPDWIRLLQFEALQWGATKQVIDESRRRQDIAHGIEWIRSQQAAGLVPRELDASQLLLAMLALSVYPVAFPQVTRMATGMRVHSPEFRREQALFLTSLGKLLGGAAGGRRAPR